MVWHRFSLLSLLGLGVTLAAGGPAARAADPPLPRWLEVTTVSAKGVEQTRAGKALIEAQDGSLLLETATQQLHLLAGDTVTSRTPLTPAAELSARSLGQQVLAELPGRFSLLTTRHYCICYDTSPGYARWAAALFERLHRGFHAFWSQLGMPISPPDHPLIVIIFADRHAYEAAAQQEVGTAAHSIVGYYNQMNNRVTSFDLTGSDTLRHRRTTSPGRAGTDILASPEAAGLVATLVHEATHQLAFNAGLHQRLAPIPVWVSEGIATYFETPDLGSHSGWQAIGSINRPRLALIRQRFTPGLLARMVSSDEPFRSPDEGLVAYAHAWALVSMLAKTQREAFAGYLHDLAGKQPLASESAADRIAAFETAFGAGPDALETPLVRYLSSLPAN